MVNNFGISSGIDVAEVSSIKRLILQRAQEKQNADNHDVKNEAMNDARTSVASNKPKLFGGLTSTYKAQESAQINEHAIERPTSAPTPNSEVVPTEQVQNVPKNNKVKQLKHNVASVQDSVYTNAVRDEVMYSATGAYRQKASLNETLRFLNTQAAISLIKKTHSKIV